MKKVKLILAAVAMLGLVSSSVAYADGFAPGEGLYLGVFGGMSTGIVQPKVATTDSIKLNSGDGTTTTFEATEGGLALFGAQGGGWIGYGYKMGDFYIGLDLDYAGSGEEFELTSTSGIEVDEELDGTYSTVTSVKAERKWRGGGAGRLGYYINADTLLSFKGGIHASQFDVNDGRGHSEEVNAGGWQFGVGLESRLAVIDPNLSVRLEATYDDYLTAPVSGLGGYMGSGNGFGDTRGNTVNSDTEVTGSGTNARIGLQYSFFDVNSLF